jgi:SpoVK/Ycf46/Vps4 family AAA+-type ATPase
VVAAYATRGELWVDESVAPYARVVPAERAWDDLAWPAEDKRLLRRRLELCVSRAADEPLAVLLRGTLGSGRKAAALALCREQRRQLLVVDAERLPSTEEDTLAAFRTVIRDARLAGAWIYVENADALRREPGVQSARLRAIASLLPRVGGLLFLGTERAERIDVEDALAPTTLEVPALTSTERRLLWRQVLSPALDPDGAHVERLVAGFPVNPGDIARTRGEIAALAAASGGVLDGGELVRAVLEGSRHNLRAIASEVATPYDLDDIVVSEEVRAQCLQLVALVERWSLLRDDWGLGRRVLTHRGISALFSGPPGTGKTMMAAILGRRLGLDVFRIDVAQIMSKWVGETEKNLARLFAEAARTRAVLVFDEADALFARRVDVRGSIDRYSNAQVNYLLQKMESFEGIMILTTNLERAVDEAFLRRIQFRVVFREPAAAEREAIWRRILPPEVALDDVNLRAVAEEFPMTGGAIRNAAVRACLIAMTRGDGRKLLTHGELVRAIVDELGRDPRKKDDPRGVKSTLLY